MDVIVAALHLNGVLTELSKVEKSLRPCRLTVYLT